MPLSTTGGFFARLVLLLSLAVGLPLASHAQENATLKVKRHAPWNLFNTTEPVLFEAVLSNAPAGSVEINAALVDETGREVAAKRIPAEVIAGKATNVVVDMGTPGRGYYELRLKTRLSKDAAKEISGQCSLGVMEFVNRTAGEVREGGFVFGLKWWSGIQNQREMEDAMCKLGLQWTRIIQNEGGKTPDRPSAAQILSEFPMNAVIKVERFPRELYDEERNGPIEEWEKKYGRGSWTIKSLPKKEPYQKWLREQIAALPAEQQVFEIWNEAWDKFSPENFATLCNWIVEAITQDRPNAIIGPNIYGRTSPYEYDAKVFKAGGMKGMKMIALHPYAMAENRAWLREYKKWAEEQLGYEIDIHITEYGSHSTPEGPARRSEMEQARRVARQSLALYAEGVKSLIPHWAGQTERNPTYIEDWYGFVRKNEQPKPVLISHANTARVVDGSRVVGDLWFGPKVEAILFERKGVRTLALWTVGDEAGKWDTNPVGREITVRPGTSDFTLVDMMGRESKPALINGELKLTVGEAPIYLVGVSPELDAQASEDLRPDRWPVPPTPPRNVRKAGKLSTMPKLDGKFDDWKGAAELGLVNPIINGYDCSGIGYLGWDEQYLYVGVDVRDNEMLNKQVRKYLYRQDSLELFVSTEPRDEGRGYGPRDFQFFLTPTSGDGVSVVGLSTDREAGVVTDVKGAKFFAGPMKGADKEGWAMEVAIPWSVFGDFVPEKGKQIAVDMLLNDADTSHERFKTIPVDSRLDVANPPSWSLLILE